MCKRKQKKNSQSSSIAKQDSVFKLRRFSTKDNNDEELQQSPNINLSKFALPATPPFPNAIVQRQEEDAPMSIGASESNYSSESYNTTQWAGMTSSYTPMSVAVPVPNYSAQSPQSAGTTNEYTPTSSSVPSESGKEDNSEEMLEAEKELAAFEKELAWELSKAAVDAAGIVDPTPISDAVGASMSLAEGDLIGAGLSLISIIPYVGDALGKTAKGARAAKKIAKLRKKIITLAEKIKSLNLAKATDKAGDAAKAADKAGGIKNTGKVGKKAIEREALLKELQDQGVKHTPENVVKIARSSDGKVIFLEKGNSQAGLKHIIEAHADDFAKRGISEKEIPDLVMKASTNGKIVGFQGKGRGRPIYEVAFNGEKHYVAVTVGKNGFIVGANPARAPSP
ncbi:MAG: hypothetical protein AAFR83_16470 [Cyanobacteria bacterium J06629_18]